MRLEELFTRLNEAKIKYILIGGIASILYGVPRTTIDVDIAIATPTKNVQKTIEVLKGMGLASDTEDVDEIVAQGGITFINDREIDILTSLPDDVDFNELWNRRAHVNYHGVSISVVSKKDQIRLLKKVGRKQDLEDAKSLEGK